ncbi:hypothetical protein [Dethiothermospora halolimnae]|uniref:hypothetical protein n=1 Tax=Dethiothermospora halolimnae TaxID=3114390 RepID=UPI003CCBB948
MIFPDYKQTGILYHIAPITDLEKILEEGIAYDDKTTYLSKYLRFHKYIDSFKPDNVPTWVIRKKALFASMNFEDDHNFHSHSAILGIKIDRNRCWVADESLVNQVYEPFILKDIKMFSCSKNYLNKEGKNTLKKYWNTSLSFNENLEIRKDKENNYDAEVMIFHKIPPKDIEVISIVSDHKIMDKNQWIELFKRGQ